MSQNRDLLLVQVKGFALDEDSKSPIVLLHPEEQEEVMPIWIGPSEASSIALSLSGAEYERPLTHDLLNLILEGLNVQHQRTEITHLEGNTFFARIVLRTGSDYVAVDCRPSDGIAMALRSEAEIYIERGLFESQKQLIRPGNDEESKEDE